MIMATGALWRQLEESTIEKHEFTLYSQSDLAERESCQSIIESNAFSTILRPKPPLALSRSWPFASNQSFEINRGIYKYWPSISVGGGQQGWWRFASRRQRSHLRSCRAADAFVLQDDGPAQLDRYVKSHY